MQYYYRCKCGHSIAHSSMGVPSCTRCGKCGSDLSTGPDCHHDPDPHRFVTKYDQNTGVPYERCDRCYQRKTELEARNEDGGPRGRCDCCGEMKPVPMTVRWGFQVCVTCWPEWQKNGNEFGGADTDLKPCAHHGECGAWRKASLLGTESKT